MQLDVTEGSQDEIGRALLTGRCELALT